MRTTSFTLRTGIALTLGLLVAPLIGVGCNCGGNEGEGEGEGEAALTITPTVQSFGTIAVGSTSADADFTVTNAGTAASGVVSASVSGSFVITASDCSAALDPDATCTVSVQFAPSAAGAASGTLTVSASPGGSASSALSGTGAGTPDLTISNSPANFGSVTVGEASSAQTFTVTNTGGDAANVDVSIGGANASDFTLGTEDCSGTLAANSSCSISVTFEPASSGIKAASLNVTADGTAGVTAAMSGTGLDDAELVIAPSQRDFGSVPTGSSSSVLNFSITNVGDVAAGALDQNISGTDASQFVITASTCDAVPLAPNASCTVSVQFNASGAAGARSATLNVLGTPGGSVAGGLSATVQPLGNIAISPTASDFGSVVVGQDSSSQTFTVTNTGGSATSALSVILSGTDADDFTLVAGSNGCQGTVLAAAGTCTIALTFGPNSGGSKAATLTVTAGTGGTTSAALSGTGLGDADLTANPTGIDFGSVATAASSGSVAVTITNGGDVASGIPTAVIGGTNFSQFGIVSNGCTAALAPAGTCTINLRYSPTALGAHSGNLTVSASPGGSTVILLAGTGITPSALAFSGGSTAAFGSHIVGATTTASTLTITNSGAETSGAISASFVGADPTQFSLTNNCTTLATGATCTIAVRFTPTVPAGAKVAQLRVTGAPGGTITSGDLTGTAVDKLTVAGTADFGDVRIGTTADQLYTFTQTNIGTEGATSGPLTITSTFGTPAQFSIIAGSSTCDDAPASTTGLTPGSTCTVTVRFAPTGATGARTGSLVVANAGTASTATVSLAGNALGTLTPAPTTIAFADTVVGNATASQNFVFTNSSTSATAALTTVRTGSSDFLITADSCHGVSVAAANTCTISVLFQPASVGAKAGSITVSAGGGNTTQVTMSGNGISAAQVVVTPATFDFGSVQAQQNSGFQIFQVSNAGQQGVVDVSFSLASAVNFNIGNLAQGTTCVSGTTDLTSAQTCDIAVRFSPPVNSHSTTPKTTTLNVSAATGGSDSSALTGTSTPQLTIVETSFNFGNDIIDGTATGAHRFTLTNGGAVATSALSTVTVTGNFARVASGQANDCFGTAVAAGASCVLDVVFNAAGGNGAKTGTLTVSGAGGDVSVSAALSGNAQNPASLTVADSFAMGADNAHDFGSMLLGAISGTATHTITNTGDVPSSAPVVTNGNAADFDIVTNGCTAALSAGGTCQITTRFAPDNAGAQTAAIAITIDGVGADGAINLAGRGTTSNPVTFTPSFRDFGSVVEGVATATPLAFTLTNTNTSATSALVVALSDSTNFELVDDGASFDSNCQGVAVAAGATCTQFVRFRPGLATGGTFFAETMTVDWNTGGVDGYAELYGRSLDRADVNVSPGAFAFADTAFGQSSATTTITVSNPGDVATGAVTAPVLSGADAARFSLHNNGCTTGLTLAADDGATGGADQCTFEVRFNPVASGPRAATVTVVVAGTLAGSGSTNLTGNGTNPALITINPSAQVDFGNTAVNAQSSTQTYVVSNDTGAQPTGGLAFSVSNTADFDLVVGGLGDCVSDNPSTPLVNEGTVLAASGSCTIGVRFSPNGPPGGETNALSVTATPGGSLTANQIGNGVTQLGVTGPFTVGGIVSNPWPTTGSELDISASTFAERDYRFTNNGLTATGLLFPFLTEGTAFAITASNCSASRAATEFCTITVRYTPTTAGTHTASISVSATPGDNPTSAISAVSVP